MPNRSASTSGKTTSRTSRKYLELLSKKYPTVQEACTEIINLRAILNLPKGTEHFISDIHGEDEAFCHILNNGSGVIRDKVNALFEKAVPSATRTELCTLIYYPEEKISEIAAREPDMEEWYRITLYRLIDVCRFCASKYTRSKVRKALPKDFEYIIDELLHTDYNAKDKQSYYENIIRTIIEIGQAEDFIISLTDVIKRLVVDHLHVVGDIYDRGPHADVILDRLMAHHAVDIQWGNHDILWMGAAAGSAACIANVLNISTKYGHLDFVENAYGINLRPLALFAQNTYKDAKGLLGHMRKAIAVIQFKLEGQLIKAHPEYEMQDRIMLERLNYEDMTLEINGKKHKLNDTQFPTVDPNDPLKLSPEEETLVAQLINSFERSEKLHRHIRFLYSQGSLYLVRNGNVLFHGCLPMTEDGGFYEFNTGKTTLSGREFMDYADSVARQAYYAPENSKAKTTGQDFMWYLWCGSKSPLFGRERMTTFERMFVDDKETWKEAKTPYYNLIENKEICEKILHEFGLDGKYSHIINGHMPVRVVDGEVPVKGDGRLIVIDGGFSKAYQSQTGIAGYTMFYNSYGIRLVSHEPFPGIEDAIKNNSDIYSTYVVGEMAAKRITVSETDVGRELEDSIADLTALLDAYRKGFIKEKQ